MRAIIIDDKDAKALINKLELESFRKDSPSFRTEETEAWHSLPEDTRTALIFELHRRFHYVVVKWLQEQGASTI